MNHTLKLAPDEMRRLGHLVVDLIVDYFVTVDDKPVAATGHITRGMMEDRFRQSIPQDGLPDIEGLVQEVRADILEHYYHKMHVRDFGYVNNPSNFVSVLADMLVTGFNVFGGAWIASPMAAQIELVAIDWLRQLFGLPETGGGLFVSGGSVANLTCMALARHIILDEDMTGAVAYFSEQTHASTPKGLRVLGFTSGQICKMPVDAGYHLDVGRLRLQIEADRAKGKRPFCVIANAGTVNTGTVDPLHELADLCAEYDMWLHIDAAYGGAGVLCEQGRATLTGIERADSISFDPHKSLFQTMEAGCVLVRDRAHLRETFNVYDADYLNAAFDPTMEKVNYYDYGIQMSRSFRALKIWMSFKAFGANMLGQSVAHCLSLAEAAEAHLRRAAHWEVCTPAQLGVITFRYRLTDASEAQEDAFNQRLMDTMNASGFAYVHSTVLQGRMVLRMITFNPRTTVEDIEATINQLEKIATNFL